MPTDSAKDQAYEARAAQVLGQFQLLEFSLKLYISAVYREIKDSVSPSICFNYGYKDIEAHPLERLLSQFAKLNRNSVLLVRLNRLRSARNDVAHRALLYKHEEIRDVLGVDINVHAVNLNKVAKELDECLGLLSGELESVFSLRRARGHGSGLAGVGAHAA